LPCPAHGRDWLTQHCWQRRRRGTVTPLAALCGPPVKAQLRIGQDFYETTLEALKDAKNERLWFKTNLKLGKLWLDMAEFNR
jgi:hypothetical protein